jgi:hypothetical protein
MEFRFPILIATIFVATHLFVGFPRFSIGQEQQEVASAASEEPSPLSPSTQVEEKGRKADTPRKEQEFVGVCFVV